MILLVLSLLLVVRSGFQMSRYTGNEWPSGRYGLPRAKTGCPSSKTSVWHEGWRFQDMEDTGKSTDERSRLSRELHMDLKLIGNKRDINRTFCIKEKTGGEARLWPKGSYCIYKIKGEACPKNMTSGWVRWDDEDWRNNNKKGGSLPDGLYDENTMINYCCQIQGNWYDSIELPVIQPFYLLTSSSTKFPKCQMVKWAFSYLEYIVFDTNDDNNGDNQGGKHVFINDEGEEGRRTVYYCYYQDCRQTMAGPSGSFRSHREAFFTSDGHWQYCSWLITIAETYVVSLSFRELTIPNCDDAFIRIFDGLNDTAPLLGTYCGSNASTEVKILSSTNNLLIMGNSGSYENNPKSVQFHFLAQYNAEHLTGCHYEVIGSTGYIKPPEVDTSTNYPRHSNCSWLVTVDDAYLVTLNVSFLKLSANDNDVIEIYDGNSENAPVLARFSRLNDTNGTLVSSSNIVFIIFKYGKSSSYHTDFAVDYSSQPKPTLATEIIKKTLITKFHTTSTSISTVKTREPESESAKQSESIQTMYIIVAVVVGVVLVLIVIAIFIFLRRRKKKAETTSVLHGINPAYSWRKKATTNSSEDDSVCYANPSSPQEKVWAGSSKVCKEGRNPIYETAEEPAALYSSTDASYEPLVENKAGAESENPLYDVSGVASSHVYAEPSAQQKNVVYDEPDVKV